MRKKIYHLLFLVCFLVTVGFSFACGFLLSETLQFMSAKLAHQAELQMKSPPPMEIARARVKPQKYWLTHDLTGSVVAWKESNLAFAESGIVTKVLVDLGDNVRGPDKNSPGQTLAMLETERLLASLEAARAESDKSRWDFERYRKLHANNIESKDRLRNAQLAYDVKNALLQIAQKRFADTHLRAPFSGKIAMRAIEVGESCTPGKVVFHLVQIDMVKIILQVPEYMVRDIAEGQKAEIAVDGITRPLFGKVWRVAPATNGRFFRTEIKVSNRDNVLKPGMIARTKIFVKKIPQAYVLPLEILVRTGNRHKVMLVKRGRVANQYYDLKRLPPAQRNRIRELVADNNGRQLDIHIDRWQQFEISPTILLKAYMKTPAQGEILRVFHEGYYAESRWLGKFLIRGRNCVIEDTKIFTPGEWIVVRGQHRLKDGMEVVISSKNRLQPMLNAEEENVVFPVHQE